ncbi:hypothetical protein BY996DRAFT_6424542 [Phakopsora pachyrhizi]|nr:hypothetical protein BY996DRAFT_6424542 [Phakopsora pachyrhizi]
MSFYEVEVGPGNGLGYPKPSQGQTIVLRKKIAWRANLCEHQRLPSHEPSPKVYTRLGFSCQLTNSSASKLVNFIGKATLKELEAQGHFFHTAVLNQKTKVYSYQRNKKTS